MTTHEFNRRMAIFTKGAEYSLRTDPRGNVIISPKGRKECIYAVIDPATLNVTYRQKFGVLTDSADIPMQALEDLKYFTELLTKHDDD